MTDERLSEVIRDASIGMYAGMVSDTDALAYAVEQGLVRRSYEGAMGMVGLAKLELTHKGHCWEPRND